LPKWRKIAQSGHPAQYVRSTSRWHFVSSHVAADGLT
jgi:hypothetical protein